MQHIAQDIICHVFSFLSYHSIPTISLVCHDWNEALGNERRECWRVWFNERVNESPSKCKKKLSKRLQKMTKSNRSERLLFMGFVQHQKVESLKKEIIKCKWGPLLPLLRRNTEIAKCLFRTHFGKCVFTLMIDKLGKMKKRKAPDSDERAIRTIHILMEEFGAVLPDEKHLVLMRRKLKNKRDKRYSLQSIVQFSSMETAPLHMALRWGFFETAKAIAKLSPVVTLHTPGEIPTRVTALESVILGMRNNYVIDPFSMVKFVVEELQEPVLPGEAVMVRALFESCMPQTPDVLEYLFSKGWNPHEAVDGGNTLSYALIGAVCYWKQVKLVDFLINAGVPLVRNRRNLQHGIDAHCNSHHLSDEEALEEWKKNMQ
jgi:hypothetical protein